MFNSEKTLGSSSFLTARLLSLATEPRTQGLLHLSETVPSVVPSGFVFEFLGGLYDVRVWIENLLSYFWS